MKKTHLLIIILFFSSCELIIFDFINNESKIPINKSEKNSTNIDLDNDLVKSNNSFKNEEKKEFEDDEDDQTFKEEESNTNSENNFKANWSNPAMGPFGISVVNYIRAYYLVGEWSIIKKFLINADCIDDDEFEYMMRNSEWGYEIDLTNLHKKENGNFIISFKKNINNTIGLDQYYGKVVNDTAKIYFHSQNKINPFIYDSKYPSSDINCLINSLSKKVHFEFNKSNLKVESKKTLEEIATLLYNYPKIKLNVNGHTSNEGSISYNNKLSYNRANEVFKFFKNFGLNNEMEVFGFGSSKQIYNESDKINNSKNRRVEIILQ